MHRRLRTLGVLLSPSLFSGSAAVSLSLAMVGGTAVVASLKSGAVYDWLLGSGSNTRQINLTQATLSSLQHAILDNPALNRTAFVVMWMLLGVAVYFLLYAILKQFHHLQEVGEDFTNRNSNSAKVGMYYVTRLVARVVFSFGWLLYWVAFVKLYVPFLMACAQIGANEWQRPQGWLFLVLGFLVGCISLHMHVICLRLICLKPRVFSAD